MSAFQAGRGGQLRRSNPERGQSGQQPGLSPQDARKIVDGDVEFLIQQAQQAAGGLRDEASRTQLRRLYGEVKRIEMLWRQGEKGDEARRRLLLLKPRLHYQVSRQPKLSALRRTLEPVIDAVGGDRSRFQHFVEFFEAIVAYAR